MTATRAPTRLWRVDSTYVFGAVLVVAIAGHSAVPRLWLVPSVQAWTTVFVAICVQATPYVVLGVAVSVALSAIPVAWLRRALPRRAALAVPAASVAGLGLPGCECGSVPVAAGLVRRDVPVGAAVAFMLAAPAANPVVLAATATAFPGQPAVVLARLVAALALAMVIGWISQARLSDLAVTHTVTHTHRLGAAAATDLARSLGPLTIGAAAAATLTVLVPRPVLARFADSEVTGVLTLAVLAVVLAVCSQADAFIASSLTQFSRLAQLTFMVVSPAVDVKVIAMQVGAFGRPFTMRLAATTFVAAIALAVGVGTVLL
jgi:hypothetical protein